MTAVAEKQSAFALFRNIDVNGNGFIEINELVSTCSDFGLFDEEVDKLLMTLVADGDGKVLCRGTYELEGQVNSL